MKKGWEWHNIRCYQFIKSYVNTIIYPENQYRVSLLHQKLLTFELCHKQESIFLNNTTAIMVNIVLGKKKLLIIKFGQILIGLIGNKDNKPKVTFRCFCIGSKIQLYYIDNKKM